MRVLLLAYHFPPDPAVGSLRAMKVARMLRDAGHEVSVIAGPEAMAEEAVREEGITVEAVRPWPWLRDGLLKGRAPKIIEASGGEAAGSGAERMSHGETGKDVPRWKRYLYSAMWTPDDRQGFIPAAIGMGTALDRRRKHDLVYSTAPPFSILIAGMVLSRILRRPWVAEFRDPWTDNPFKAWWLRSRPTDALERWLEKRVLSSADTVVAVTEATGESFRAKLSATKAEPRVIVVRNGIDVLSPAPPPSHDGEAFNIAHAGTLYLGRNPRPLLEAVGRLCDEDPGLLARIRLQLIGTGREYAGVSVRAVAEQLGVGQAVEFYDWVSHEDCQKMLESSDMLLLFAQGQPDQVPNKLYEYLGLRKPILAVCDAEGESASMLRRVGGHYVVSPDDRHAMASALADAMGNATPGTPRGDAAVLESWTSARQMATLRSELERLSGGR